MSAALRQFWRNYPGWVSASDNSGVPTTYTRSEDIHMSLPEQEYLSAYEGVIARALRILPPGFIGKTRLSRLVGERILQKQNVRVTTRRGMQFLMPSLREPVAFYCLFDGVYEPETMKLLAQHLPVGGTFVDIGANVGVFTVHASRLVGHAGRILAVEASPQVQPYLEHNLWLNGCTNVVLVKKAVARSGPTRLPFWPAPPEKFGMGALAAQFDADPTFVNADTLSAMLQSNHIKRVDMLKIDIEGFEAEAFYGAKDLLTGPHRPRIIFEFADWAETRAGASAGDAQRLLIGLGYELFIIENGGVLRKIQEPLVKNSANFLAVPL